MAPAVGLYLLLLVAAVSAGTIRMTLAKTKDNATSTTYCADYIDVCKRNDPQIEACIIKSIEKLRGKLKGGISELDVPGLDPLVIPELVISRGEDASRFRAVGHNVKVYGAGQFKITNLRADVAKHQFAVTVGIPFLYFQAEYDVNARILSVPIKGKGTLYANATDCVGDITLKGQLTKKDGGTYLYFYNIDVKVDVNKIKVQLEGLFGNDKALGEATNQALNENSQDFWPAVKPYVERTIGEVALDAANKITGHFTYEDLFPQK